MGVKEVNNEGTHAPYIGNRPAGMDVHGPEDPSKDGGDLGRAGKWQGSLLEGAAWVQSCRTSSPGRQGNPRQKEQHVQRHGALLKTARRWV